MKNFSLGHAELMVECVPRKTNAISWKSKYQLALDAINLSCLRPWRSFRYLHKCFANCWDYFGAFQSNWMGWSFFLRIASHNQFVSIYFVMPFSSNCCCFFFVVCISASARVRFVSIEHNFYLIYNRCRSSAYTQIMFDFFFFFSQAPKYVFCLNACVRFKSCQWAAMCGNQTINWLKSILSELNAKV